MEKNRSNVGALVGGTLLIAFGLLSLAGQIFRDLNWGFFWPFIVIAFGALFFVAMFSGAKGSAAFAIPGSIISGVGLILLFQNITQHWETMSYFWALIIVFVGIGIYIMGWYGRDESQKKSGAGVIKVGLFLFIIFGAFFEMILGSFSGMLFPIMLIILGGYLILTRSGLLSGKKSGEASNDAIPPVS